PVFSVNFSPDGKLLASGSNDHTARIWVVATGTPRHILKGHADAVFGVLFTPDSKALVSSARGDRSIFLWETATGKEVRRWQSYHYLVHSSALTAGGKLLATASPSA